MQKELEEEEKPQKKNNESYLCHICRHYDYCIIRKFGPVHYCELFDFKDKEEDKK